MLGAAAGKVDSYHSNIGLKPREEIALTGRLTAVVGFSANWSRAWGVDTVYNYNANSVMTLPQRAAADNDCWNTAPRPR